MGSEQSSHGGQKPSPRAPAITRGHTIAATERLNLHRGSRERLASGNDSPGTSICSDPELPYVSYTQSTPIGDSPKHSARSRPTKKPAKRPLVPRRQTSLPPRHTYNKGIVVVRTANSYSALDADVARLQEIPTFLPIMRGTLGLPGARDQDVLEGLDCRPIVRLTSVYQNYMASNAVNVATEQNMLTAKSKEIDAETSRLHSQFVDRQRSNARNAERLSRVREISHQISRCQSILNRNIQDLEELNMLLPIDKRLEPFVWTT